MKTMHLALAREVPPAPRYPLKPGGGGGDDNLGGLVRHIMADPRPDHLGRELLLALAYAHTAAPDDGPAQWDLVRHLLGTNRHGRHRLGELAAHDAPRYVSPVFNRRDAPHDPLYQRCQAPRLRPFRTRLPAGTTPEQLAGQAEADEQDLRNVHRICGEPTPRRDQLVIERLPGAGWHQPHWRCDRHRSDLTRIRDQVLQANQTAPEPIPNHGGLLPAYFEYGTTNDWAGFYQHHTGGRWTPPSHGICADDWPTPGREPAPRRSRLRLAALDGHLLDTRQPPTEGHTSPEGTHP